MDGSQTGIARTPNRLTTEWRFVVKLDELITQIEVEEQATRHRREKAKAEIEMILTFANKEGRANLTKDEQERCDQLEGTAASCKEDLVGITQKLTRARKAKAEELEIAEDTEKREQTTAGSTKPAYDRVARVGQEERTYSKKSDRSGGLFLRDVAAMWLQSNPESGMRLSGTCRRSGSSAPSTSPVPPARVRSPVWWFRST
jgi:hypothetical protein